LRLIASFTIATILHPNEQVYPPSTLS
jgi:hypothetical protein